MRTVAKEDHMRVQSGTMKLMCKNCGEEYQPNMPCSIDIYAAIVRVFKKQHKACKPALPGKKGE